MNYRGIIRSSLIVSGGFLAAKVLGFVREILIARAFGTTGQLDAYYAAFNLPDLLFALIPGGALASVFIPVLAGYLTDEDREGGWRLASAVVNVVFLVVAVGSVVVAATAPWLVGSILAPGFTPARQALTVDLMRLVLLSTLIFAVSGVIMGTLHAHQHFVMPAVAPVVYNLGIIFGAVVLAPRMGIFGLAWGVVAGAALHLAVQLPALVRFGARWSPTLGLGNTGAYEIVRLIGPRILTLGVVRINFLVMTNLASGLGEGSVSALSYAWNLMQLPESLIGTAIATAAFPTLSELAARGDRDGLRRTFATTFLAILGLAVPAAVALIALGRPLIRLFFERGAFDANSTQAVFWALQFYALGLAGHSLLEVATRVFYAEHDTRTPFLIAAGAMLAHLALSLTLSRVLGHGGLALANSIAVTIEVSGLLVLARRRLWGRPREVEPPAGVEPAASD